MPIYRQGALKKYCADRPRPRLLHHSHISVNKNSFKLAKRSKSEARGCPATHEGRTLFSQGSVLAGAYIHRGFSKKEAQEQMTDADLKQLRARREHLRAIEAQLHDLRSGAIRSQSLNPLPSGKGYQRDTSDYLVKYEKVLAKYYDIEADYIKLWTQILDAFAALDVREQTIMQLYYIQGMGIDDIGAFMFMSVRNIARLKREALNKLKDVPLTQPA